MALGHSLEQILERTLEIIIGVTAIWLIARAVLETTLAIARLILGVSCYLLSYALLSLTTITRLLLHLFRKQA